MGVQLILGTETDEVMAILPMGDHPGTEVVEGPLWNSRPLPLFRTVHVILGEIEDFDDLMAEDLDDDLKPRSDVTRVLEIDFLPPQANEIAVERTINVPASAALRRRPNPRGSQG